MEEGGKHSRERSLAFAVIHAGRLSDSMDDLLGRATKYGNTIGVGDLEVD